MLNLHGSCIWHDLSSTDHKQVCAVADGMTPDFTKMAAKPLQQRLVGGPASQGLKQGKTSPQVTFGPQHQGAGAQAGAAAVKWRLQLGWRI
jgi:hypothetical protein